MKGYLLDTSTCVFLLRGNRNVEEKLNEIDESECFITDTVVAELGELIKSSPGKTQVYFLMHDTAGKKHVLLRSASTTIDVRNELIHYIEQTDALSYKIN